MPSPKRLVLLGVFGAAQGVRGEVRVKSYTAVPKAIGAYGALTDKAGARAFVFESLRALKDEMLVARVKGVSTREAAQALTGVEIFARREQLPPPDENEFYYDDLVGLAKREAHNNPEKAQPKKKAQERAAAAAAAAEKAAAAAG